LTRRGDQNDEHILCKSIAYQAQLSQYGQVLVAKPKRNHWVRFAVRSVPATQAKPRGLDYSLSLHGPKGERLVGFDNARPVRAGAGPAEGMGRRITGIA